MRCTMNIRETFVYVSEAKDRGTAAAETGVPKGRYSTMCYIVGFAVAPLLSAFVYQRRKCSAYCHPRSKLEYDGAISIARVNLHETS